MLIKYQCCNIPGPFDIFRCLHHERLRCFRYSFICGDFVTQPDPLDIGPKDKQEPMFEPHAAVLA